MKTTRRSFLKASAAAPVLAPLVVSVEEFRLLAQQPKPAPTVPGGSQKAAIPQGKIGNVSISRLICGGNLISGYAHSRDLIYVSSLLKHYFTDDKVLETWTLCEQYGVNTMVLNPSDTKAAALYQRYRDKGGKIQYLAQLGPEKDKLQSSVVQAKRAGAVGAFLLGNYTDTWTRDGDTKLIGELLGLIKQEGLIAGVAAHELRAIKTVESAGCAPDFYMKTLHQTNYWSSRRADQLKEVVDNYGIDNYWCMDPKETIAYMSELRRPWIAYKVLAAGAIHPRSGFLHAFDSGADFINVGMFDFQIAENAAVVTEVLPKTQNREREWLA